MRGVLGRVLRADGDERNIAFVDGRGRETVVVGAALRDRGLWPQPGDLVTVDAVTQPKQITYLWRQATVAEVADGVISIERDGATQQAWTLGRLGPLPRPGDVVFTDARNGRSVIVDLALPSGDPAHPDRFTEGYNSIRDDIADMTFWLKERPKDKLHNDALDIDETLVRRLLDAQFPEWANLSLERIRSSGTVHVIYRLGSTMSVRLPLATRFDGDTDKCWLDFMAPLVELRIPRVLGEGGPDEAYPCRWVVTDWLPGGPWQDEIVGDDEQVDVLVRFIRALQRVTRDESPCPATDDVTGLHGRNRTVRAGAEAARQWVDTERVLASWDRALEATPWTAEPLLVHGDLFPGNVLVEGGRVSAIIDWGNVHFGDPATDLVAAWRLFGRDARREFVSAFEFDRDTWVRAHGLALASVNGIAYYADTNPGFVGQLKRTLDEALADDPRDW